jgi:hypothetical protein
VQTRLGFFWIAVQKDAEDATCNFSAAIKNVRISKSHHHSHLTAHDMLYWSNREPPSRTTVKRTDLAQESHFGSFLVGFG